MVSRHERLRQWVADQLKDAYGLSTEEFVVRFHCSRPNDRRGVSEQCKLKSQREGEEQSGSSQSTVGGGGRKRARYGSMVLASAVKDNSRPCAGKNRFLSAGGHCMSTFQTVVLSSTV